MTAYARCELKIIGRSDGHHAVKAAAYRSGDTLKDYATGKTIDYARKGGVLHSEIVLPEHAPASFASREVLWNVVEAGENRKDSQLAREVIVCFPRQLDLAEQIAVTRRFVADFVAKGMIADFAIHTGAASDGGENPHAHILLTMRDISEKGFSAKKNRDWNTATFSKGDWVVDSSKLVGVRADFCRYVNEALEAKGSHARTNLKSYAEQGIQKIPGIHRGKEHHHQHERTGKRTARIRHDDFITARNKALGNAKSPYSPSPEDLIRRKRQQQQVLPPVLAPTPPPPRPQPPGKRPPFTPEHDYGLDR